MSSQEFIKDQSFRTFFIDLLIPLFFLIIGTLISHRVTDVAAGRK